MQRSFIYIQTFNEFKQFRDEVKGCSIVGIDTEFERTRTYWPDLCLLQIATSQTVFVIEPSAFDLPWLSNFMADTSIIKIFHSCRQDLEAFYALSGVVPQNVFDTQVAATLVGIGDQISYADLCQNLLQLELSKELQWSNWAARPLLPEQIAYAANDARYLIPLYQNLTHQLQQVGRQDLMRNILSTYEDRKTYQKDARLYFMNKLYLPSIPIDHSCILYQLAEWREQYCLTHNVMRRLVLEDKDLQTITPFIPFSEFLPEHPMREVLYNVMTDAQNKRQMLDFLQVQPIGFPIKVLNSRIRHTLADLKIPMHYVVTKNMILDFLLDQSHEENPLFNSWRYTLLESSWDKLLMIKRNFQAQQNQSKTSHKNVGKPNRPSINHQTVNHP